MRFAAVIVLHNSARELTALLESIDAHLAFRPQVICADSGSSDDGADVAREWGAEVLVMDGNPGYGAANNAALELVSEEVTVLLNPDSLLIDGGIVRLAEAARAGRALVAPKLLNDDRSVQDSAHPLPGGRDGYLAALTVPRLLPATLRNRLQPFRSTTRTEVGWAIGACLAARTTLLRELGPFNADDFLFGEDLDLCLRARALGIPTIFDPSVSLVHSGGHTSRGELRQERFDLQARRRRDVILQQLGEGALRRDDRTQALTFTVRDALGRDRSRNKMLLAALRGAQNRSS
ncbi:MAG: glycosyltransferase family 2 protein [Solirubrobacteraceae bacterium]|nr:glycosyltransferase family 2 protein [Solirubrobacteraceae bacterium]